MTINRNWLAVLTLLANCACTCQGPTMVPPPRMATGGAPVSYKPGGGQVRLSGGGAFTADRTCWGGEGTSAADGQVTLGVTRMLALEASVFWLPGVGDSVTMGALGLRVSPALYRVFRFSLSAGAGLGRGGGWSPTQQGSQNGPFEPSDELAAGGYLDLNIGAWIGDNVGLYLLARFQAAGSRDLPTTFWTEVLGGVEVGLGRPILLGVELGLVHYTNSIDHRVGGLALGTLGVRWGRI